MLVFHGIIKWLSSISSSQDIGNSFSKTQSNAMRMLERLRSFKIVRSHGELTLAQ